MVLDDSDHLYFPFAFDFRREGADGSVSTEFAG